MSESNLKMVLEAIRLGKAHHVYISKTVYDSISEKEIRSDKAAGNRYAGYAESDVLKMVEGTDYDIVSDAGIWCADRYCDAAGVCLLWFI